MAAPVAAKHFSTQHFLFYQQKYSRKIPLTRLSEIFLIRVLLYDELFSTEVSRLREKVFIKGDTKKTK